MLPGNSVTMVMTGTYISGGAHVGSMSDLLGDHAQLLKVDEAVHIGVVAQVDESEVFLHHREDGDLVTATGHHSNCR